MFASNFPVDSLCATYNEIFGGFLELTRNWTKADQEAAFIKTAVDIYRLDPALLSAEHAPLRAYSPEMQKALVAK
jgi:hypothetical protein